MSALRQTLRGVAVTCAVTLGLLGAAWPAAASGSTAAPPSAPGSTEEVPDLEVTEQMIADATFDLRPDDATRGLETVREEEEETVMVLTSDLLFAFGSAELSPQAAAAVTELVAIVPQGAGVAVDGHTDALGGDAVNDPLSRERAEAVAVMLRSTRPDLVLTVTGHGSRQPVADNTVGGQDNPEGRALNRRVELSFPSP